MTDDDFEPSPPPSVQKAIPIGPAKGKPAGIQHEPVTRAVGLASTCPVQITGAVDRSESARAGWAKRRERQHHLPDRHSVGELTVGEAVELARLITKYPVLKKVLGA